LANISTEAKVFTSSAQKFPEETYMKIKSAVSLAALATVSVLAVNVPAHAQSPREAEIIGFHQLCDQGDRRACIRFGVMLGENKAFHEEWRHRHPEWWSWEH